MADLVEVPKWEEGIYQLETSDPVEGGPDGIDNVQARQLGNRTRYLKDQQEAHVEADNPHPQYATLVQMKAAIEALVASAPGALDTLNELAAALGNDPNFATTMTNQLALKAALDSPLFTGMPKAPTPDQFDASKRIATMESLRRELGSMAGTDTRCVGMAADVNLPASCVGKLLPVQGDTSRTIFLPSTAALPDGASIAFYNLNPSANGASHTISAQPNQNIIVTTAFAQTMPLAPGDIVTLTVYAGSWTMSSGCSKLSLARMNAFAWSNAQNGYQMLPSGLILQWGYVIVAPSSLQTITLPLTYPSANLGVAGFADDVNANGTQYRWTGGNRTRSTLGFVNNWESGPIAGSWISWGY
ncbi:MULTISPECIES: gp53-like domain-containing protein [Burkholderia]|uniref:gp53-like domain-containing protein n=1 Tax=Burkholderia TaxID=32008 RepID=UPI0019070AB8|nr:hypothetical protein [Burkholderia multivorans]MBJ9623051.1 hypothetical protein [Burkholderia multivorans]